MRAIGQKRRHFLRGVNIWALLAPGWRRCVELFGLHECDDDCSWESGGLQSQCRPSHKRGRVQNICNDPSGQWGEWSVKPPAMPSWDMKTRRSRPSVSCRPPRIGKYSGVVLPETINSPNFRATLDNERDTEVVIMKIWYALAVV